MVVVADDDDDDDDASCLTGHCVWQVYNVTWADNLLCSMYAWLCVSETEFCGLCWFVSLLILYNVKSDFWKEWLLCQVGKLSNYLVETHILHMFVSRFLSQGFLPEFFIQFSPHYQHICVDVHMGQGQRCRSKVKTRSLRPRVMAVLDIVQSDIVVKF